MYRRSLLQLLLMRPLLAEQEDLYKIANRFAEKYIAWAGTRNTMQDNELNYTEIRQWKAVEDAWSTLRSAVKRDHGK